MGETSGIAAEDVEDAKSVFVDVARISGGEVIAVGARPLKSPCAVHKGPWGVVAEVVVLEGKDAGPV